MLSDQPPRRIGRPPRPVPDLSELREVCEEIQALAARRRTLAARRDQLILDAVREGASYRAVASVAALAPQRVSQIVAFGL